MKIFPSLDEILELQKDGQYRVAPVCCELLSDICTPIQAVRKLKNVSSHCFLLESAEERETWGRYTFLGFDPKMSITCTDGRLQAGVGAAPDPRRIPQPSHPGAPAVYRRPGRLLRV